MLDQETVGESQSRLLRRIAAQDRQALAEFYDQMATPLYSTSVRILGDAHEAQEVIQDVFVQIWDKAHIFDATLGSPFHWAISITRNRSIDRLRARQRRARVLDEFETEISLALPPGGTHHAGLNEDELASVRTVVKSLPPEQGQAIEMAFFGGLSHEDTAEALGVSVITVKREWAAAKAWLKQELSPS